MDEKFLEDRKKDLLLQKKRLEKELSQIATKNNGDYSPKFPAIGDDEEDNELEVSEYDANISSEKELEKMLNETKEALKRIEAGTYGYCDNCKQEIDPARLEAYPAATTCIRCDRDA